MTRLSSSSSSFLFYAACVQLIALRCVCDGLSIKSTTYYDSMCDQPTGAMTHTYGNLHVDPEDGFTTLGETYTYSSRSIKGETEREYVEKKELLSLACWAEVGWQCCGVVVACCGCYSEYNTTLRAGSCPLPFLPINCTRSRFVVLSSWCV